MSKIDAPDVGPLWQLDSDIIWGREDSGVHVATADTDAWAHALVETWNYVQALRDERAALITEVRRLREERGDLLWVLNLAESLSIHEPCERCPAGSSPDECSHANVRCVHCALQPTEETT